MDFVTLITGIKSGISALSSIQSASVLRERITFINEQIKFIEQVAAKSEKEKSELTKKVVQLENELATYREREQFKEHRGAFFKLESPGRYANAVYCPKCRTSTGSIDACMPFYCSSCKWSSIFESGRLSQVISEI